MRNTLFVLLAVFFTTELFAAHIIGGEITYECLGTGQYRFTLKLYRDCAGEGALFDGAPGTPFNATISVFRGNNILPQEVVQLSNPVVSPISIAESNPCIVPPSGICVQSGVYIWDMNLPVVPESYTISYQRCCRNNTISNIVNPGEVGATYEIEITPEAQQLCNSSPEFENLPPIVICSNQQLSFDFSATDPDGDVLVYNLCTPLDGGGNNTQNPTIYSGVAPDPESPPPYNGVPFIAGQFSASNPMGGAPPLSINPNTGLLTGVPVFTGQFVVGVCVEEYRNGVLLSKVRRDFQFNVTTCQPTVEAELNIDEIDSEGVYQIKVCGDDSVEMDNISYQLNFIDFFEWTFDNGTDTISNTSEWEPVFDLPGVGSYDGSLVLNPGLFCTDSLRFRVNVFPSVEAGFDFEYDTCDYGPVQFFDESFSNAGPNTLVDWNWEFGDGEESIVQDPIHLYEIPGDLAVQLRVEDLNGCDDDTVQVVPYFPVPDLIVLSPDKFIACVPDSVYFENLSVPIDETYTIDWDFGDGNTGEGVSPEHFYTEAGVFTVSLDIISPIGCTTDTVFENLITMLPSTTAGFSYSPEEIGSFNPEVEFFDESIEASAYYWNFNNENFSVVPNPVHVFSDTGLVEVQQIVTHQSGCRDTAYAVLDIVPRVTYFLPNAFTPNLDGNNDEYKGKGVYFGMRSFNMQIWDRYGELIFESADPQVGWNGRKNNTGKEAPEGVYMVFVEYVSPRSERIVLRSYASLIR